MSFQEVLESIKLVDLSADGQCLGSMKLCSNFTLVTLFKMPHDLHEDNLHTDRRPRDILAIQIDIFLRSVASFLKFVISL